MIPTFLRHWYAGKTPFWITATLTVFLIPGIFWLGYLVWAPWYLAKTVTRAGVNPTELPLHSLPGWGTIEFVGTYVPLVYLLVVTAPMWRLGVRPWQQHAGRALVGAAWAFEIVPTLIGN